MAVNHINQNLLNELPARKVTRPKRFYKSIILDALAVLSALALGYVYKLFLGKQAGLPAAATAAGVLLVFSGLEFFLSPGFRRRFLVIVLEIVSMLVFFVNQPIATLAAAAAIFIFFSLWAEMAARYQINNFLEIRFFKTVKPALNKIVTALSFIVVLLYLPQLDPKSAFLSPKSFQALFDWSAGIVAGFYPEVNLNASFGDAVESIARVKLSENPAFKGLSANDQRSAIAKTVASLVENFEKEFKTTIDAKKPAGQVFYDFVIGTLEKWRGKFGESFSHIWALFLFLIVWSSAAIFSWVAAAAGFVIFQMLVSFGFIHIVGETRTKEVAEF